VAAPELRLDRRVDGEGDRGVVIDDGQGDFHASIIAGEFDPVVA